MTVTILREWTDVSHDIHTDEPFSVCMVPLPHMGQTCFMGAFLRERLCLRGVNLVAAGGECNKL